LGRGAPARAAAASSVGPVPTRAAPGVDGACTRGDLALGAGCASRVAGTGNARAGPPRERARVGGARDRPWARGQRTRRCDVAGGWGRAQRASPPSSGRPGRPTGHVSRPCGAERWAAPDGPQLCAEGGAAASCRLGSSEAPRAMGRGDRGAVVESAWLAGAPPASAGRGERAEPARVLAGRLRAGGAHADGHVPPVATLGLGPQPHGARGVRPLGPLGRPGRTGAPPPAACLPTPVARPPFPAGADHAPAPRHAAATRLQAREPCPVRTPAAA
jgi:hypothetical protein